ncbi:MAG: hypothetical protein J6Q15_00385 [Clostridia bacterium]|nr:hypothetical protein [Clostridia bacterium]
MLTKVSMLKASKRLETAEFASEYYAEYFAKERKNSVIPSMDDIEDCLISCALEFPFNDELYECGGDDPQWLDIETIVYNTIKYALFIDFGICCDF